MSAIKSYFKQEINPRMFKIEHQKPADFYLSNWQTTRSAVPLLILRVVLLLASLTIVLSSLITYIVKGKFRFWFIYLTHWGLTSILLATSFAVAVSARIYLRGPISGEYNLPWYVKIFWVLCNIATPFAFLITVFYWTVLYSAGMEEEVNHTLDVAVHGINSIIMFLLLLSSSLPVRLLHIYQPLLFGITYMLFGLFYHLGGGIDRLGNPYIYSVIDWSKPGTTVVVLLITGILLILLHFFTTALAVARDAGTARCFRKSQTVKPAEGMPLRQPEQVYA
ncbi:unnamed protein product [Arctia plantaginis]|uniref:Protein rolling stone-like n=1 Tax=Arctia plantaginis TaxID=874455 RepID=A0A8S1A8S6_ARCPL|nr:unnamed protein product [Arctia plantaginis]